MSEPLSGQSAPPPLTYTSRRIQFAYQGQEHTLYLNRRMGTDHWESLDGQPLIREADE